MPQRKHILLLTPGFAADETDSQCIPALQVFVKALKDREEVDISVVSLHYPQRHKQGTWYGIDTYAAFGANKAAIFYRAWKWIRHINKQKPIDLIHSFWLNDAALLGHWIGQLKAIPHMVTLMGQDVRPSNTYLKYLPLSNLKTVALSNFHAQTYLHTTSFSVDHIIPWGMEQWPVKVMDNERTIDILGVGNLIPLKAYDQFIRIVKKLSLSHHISKVEIIGDGSEKVHLQQLTTDLGLDDIIHFCGKIDRAEVLERMHHAKILLHPCTFESFGMVFLEALSSGAYVVSREVGIAHASDRWLLAETEDEFIEQCAVLFNKKQFYHQTLPHPIENTVDTYLEIYASASSH